MVPIDQATDRLVADAAWKPLYRVGGVAALMSGVFFRRNLAAEISLFSPQRQPDTIQDWFSLLQSHTLLALSYLNFFDLFNYAFVGLMLLALYVLLRRVNRSYMAIATALGLAGITVAIASSTALSTLALSDQFARSTNDAQRSTLLAAGQAMLAINPFSNPDAHPGAGGYISLLFIALAGMITSLVMLTSDLFSRPTAYVGILAAGFDLAYCIAFVVMPREDGALLALSFLPTAGLLLMIWHIVVGWRLYQLSRTSKMSIPRERSAA